MVSVRPWVVFVFYYAYGCIDEKEKARLAVRKADVKETASKERAMDFEEVR